MDDDSDGDNYYDRDDDTVDGDSDDDSDGDTVKRLIKGIPERGGCRR